MRANGDEAVVRVQAGATQLPAGRDRLDDDAALAGRGELGVVDAQPERLEDVDASLAEPGRVHGAIQIPTRSFFHAGG